MSKREFNTGDVIYWFDPNSIIRLASCAIIYRIQGMKISAFLLEAVHPLISQGIATFGSM